MLRELNSIGMVPMTSLSFRQREFSQDDLEFLKIAEDDFQKVKDRYEFQLFFRVENLCLLNNIFLAEKRLDSLKRKFDRNPDFKQEYISFVNKMLEKGYAQEVKDCYSEGKSWFIPHHGVCKLRVVFDCSLKFRGRSLNKELLKGPDLTNHLIGVLQIKPCFIK